MTCPQCGTEISEKAIVCFRCGRATAEPGSARPAAARASGRPVPVALAGLLVLVVAALFMGTAAAGRVPAWMSYTVAALAAVVLIWRIARRRRA